MTIAPWINWVQSFEEFDKDFCHDKFSPVNSSRQILLSLSLEKFGTLHFVPANNSLQQFFCHFYNLHKTKIKIISDVFVQVILNS